jgi:hypothetical protein
MFPIEGSTTVLFMGDFVCSLSREKQLLPARGVGWAGILVAGERPWRRGRRNQTWSCATLTVSVVVEAGACRNDIARPRAGVGSGGSSEANPLGWCEVDSVVAVVSNAGIVPFRVV